MTPDNVPQYLVQHSQTGRYLIRTAGLVDWTTSPQHATRASLAYAKWLKQVLWLTARIRANIINESHTPKLENN